MSMSFVHFTIIVMIIHFNNIAWVGNGRKVNYYARQGSKVNQNPVLHNFLTTGKNLEP